MGPPILLLRNDGYGGQGLEITCRETGFFKILAPGESYRYPFLFNTRLLPPGTPESDVLDWEKLTFEIQPVTEQVAKGIA